MASGLLDRLLALCLAMMFSTLFLGVKVRITLKLHRPALWLDKAIAAADRKLNRETRSSGTRVYRGLIVMLLLMGLMVGSSVVLGMIRQHLHYGIYLEIVVLAVLLPIRSSLQHAHAIARLLAAKKEKTALHYLSAWMQLDKTSSDQHTLARMTIEHLTEQLASQVVAIAFWYLLLGLPGALMAAMLHRLDARIGHATRRHLAFGWAASRSNDVLQWVPARFAALLIVAAAFLVPKGRPLGAIRILAKDRHNTFSPNAGWPIAATAGALNLTLAGPKRIEGAVAGDDWIGKGTAKATQHDVMRSLWLYAIASGLLWMSVVGLMGAW